MTTASPRIVIIGDPYVPAATIDSAIRDRLGDAAAQIVAVDWTIPGGGPAIHALQHQIELHGPDAVDVPADLVDLALTADILVVHFLPVPTRVITGNKALRAVVVARAGTENVNATVAAAQGIAVRSIAGRNAPAVAEITLGLVLAEMRNIARADRSIATGGWRKDYHSRSTELGGRTVGLIGYGQVGRRFVTLLSGFDVTVVASDPYADRAVLEGDGVTPVTFDEVFEQADVIAVFARLTEENVRFIGRDQFAKMKPTAYFVNTARSRLVDYDALLDALEHDQIAGAALDVFDEEPLPADSRWRQLDNTTLTVHFAGDTPESFRRSGGLVAEVIDKMLKDESHAPRN
ncbi:NAD(P)-dependent oxidoreductase [Microbacterium sp. ET2]|uniref:NAD(P)-dependent oxidoreductase n=1 Tax=Microbacterium albipurpureum TaxID=3050384 RepID=UPI00259D0A71|nr:NAD(P)-dependent oxidoreductase [Microbacterium sp. ET2 (Ac-2212)]WJL97003.1 NAD(P)-dependent oxidoreductase [Microbacterium sp. ET2 (Ac-2212)]